MNVEQQTKKCSKCDLVQDASEFFKDKTRKSGLTPQCKTCARAYKRKKNPDYGTSGRGTRFWLAKDGHKRCGRCKTTKPVADFSQNRVTPDGLQHYCKPCGNEAARNSYLKHKEKNREKHRQWQKNGNLKAAYGITLEEFNLMMLEQNNKCAICHEEMDPPHVDHDHTQEDGDKKAAIRALLCGPCNTGMGMFKDNTELLLRAVSYLDAYKAKEPLVSGP